MCFHTAPALPRLPVLCVEKWEAVLNQSPSARCFDVSLLLGAVSSASSPPSGRGSVLISSLLSVPLLWCLLALKLFNLGAMPRGMWDLSSAARGLSCAPAVEAWSPNRWAGRGVPALESPEDLYQNSSPSRACCQTHNLMISLTGSVVNPVESCTAPRQFSPAGFSLEQQHCQWCQPPRLS